MFSEVKRLTCQGNIMHGIKRKLEYVVGKFILIVKSYLVQIKNISLETRPMLFHKDYKSFNFYCYNFLAIECLWSVEMV